MIQFTKKGLEKIRSELNNLNKERPLAVEDLRKAREMGDLSENGYYKAAKSKLSGIDYRIRTLSYQIKKSKIIEGRKVVLQNNEGKQVEYTIVGDLEANPSEGYISQKSPIGKAIVGKKVGDTVEIITPSGKKVFKILED